MSANRRSELRQSTSEMAVLSPHAFGVDDDAEPCLLCSKLRKIVFSVWVTLSEHKRVILHERRSIVKHILLIVILRYGIVLCVS